MPPIEFTEADRLLLLYVADWMAHRLGEPPPLMRLVRAVKEVQKAQQEPARG